MRKRGIILLTVLFMALLWGGSLLVVASSKQEPKLKEEAIRWIEDHQPLLIDLSDQIWGYAELGLKEFKSSELLADALEEAGFQVERGVAGMPTAFVATYGEGEPVIGLLAEYDALPGLSQKVSSTQEPLEEGAPGHGCGHNLLGVGSVGAALAVKEVLAAHPISGTIKLFGCPAEETLIGKVYMVKYGLIDGLSAALTWHPSSTTKVSNRSSLAMNSFWVEFRGRTAHGAGDPWNGRSALDAVELMNYGVNLMREHMELTSRIHYVITDGGEAPNVVPDYARVWYYVRNANREKVEELYQRVLNIAQGAALATDTTYQVNLITGVYNTLVNNTGVKIMHSNLELVGPPLFSSEELTFAREIQKGVEKPEVGLAEEIEPIKEPPKLVGGGSSDVADVSWITPTVSLNVATTAKGTPGHSWATVASCGSPIGHKGMLVAAKTLAATAVDLIYDGELLKQMREEWKEKTQGFTYKSPLPEGRKSPSLPK
ncbi:peptidase M20 [bacterium (candidate division B38) B3_B38]|nr:MAG: peptidase M20 [bacterium (candidate division B38) B3_B38]